MSEALVERTASPGFRELDALLSEDPAAAARRASARLDTAGAAFVLYGAGTLGLTVLSSLRRAGLDAAAFADDTPEKQGTFIQGVPVMTAREASERFGDRAVFVVTILNPLLRFVDARERLRGLTSAPVVSFLDVAWTFPESFLPYYQFERPENVLGKRDDIMRAAELFADEESVRQFAAHLRFRLHLDYDALPPNSRDDYFPEGVFPPLGDECVFVDCGAYDGDTVRTFLREQNGRFGEVHAFEPDSRNCARLAEYVNGLDPDAARRIHVHCAAVGEERGTLRFNDTGNMSAALTDSGTTEVMVIPVDEIVHDETRPVYVKYDVEGGEWEALRGTGRLLRQSRPTLAVSIYHRPDDLWQLPLYLHSLGLRYRLYLRTQGEDGMDVICYAVPN